MIVETEAKEMSNQCYEEARELQKTDPVRAFGMFQELAVQEMPDAMLRLAYAYEIGMGTPVDKTAAASWYHRAQVAGDDEARMVARLGEARLLQATDPVLAFSIFQEFAEQNVPEAMTRLAYAYEIGMGTPVDKTAAASWYHRTQVVGDEETRRFARLGEARLLQATDPISAFNIFRELAEQNVPEAITRLAHAYETGVGTPVDKAAAAHWYRRAYDAGSKEVKQYIIQKEAYDLREKDPSRAFALRRELAEQGAAESMLRLAWAYWQGQGTVVDKIAAERWYRRACESNEETVKRQANYYCGVLLEEQQRYAEAYEMFSSGAALEYAPALLRLGRLYLKGRGVSRDRNRAMTLYEQAAARGNLVAKSSLGFQWMRGRGGLKNIIPGARLWMQAVGEIAAICKKIGREDERVLP